MASIERTAYPRFRKIVSARELFEAFTPTPEEKAWAREATRTEANLLALVTLLKAFQRLGYFPRLAEVPAPVVAHVPGGWGWATRSQRTPTPPAPLSATAG